MTYSLFITGCQYNYYDAKNITRFLTQAGYIYVDDEKTADLIIVLACSVRQKPLDRIFGKIKIWQKLPQKPKIIITSCILPNDRKRLQSKVDAIISINNFEKEFTRVFSARIKKKSADNLELYQTDDDPNTALIPIMQGCNNFCSYCAVPYVRGREVSRPSKEIIEEIKKELKRGKKQILLLGQNVNSFGITRKQNNKIIKKYTFVDLLKEIEKITEDFTYNFMSANPRNFSRQLVEILPKLEKWQRVLHLPLQSGDDKILTRMNRKYSANDYLKLVSVLKSKITNLKLSTDIIVGFPGETEKQFENTYKLCKIIGFSKAYVSQYSPRSGTLAARFKDNILPAEKKKRWKILDDLINKKIAK